MQNCYEIEKNQTAALEEINKDESGRRCHICTEVVIRTVSDFNSDGICSFNWF